MPQTLSQSSATHQPLGTSLFKALNAGKVRAFQGIPGPQPNFLLGNIQDFQQGLQTWEVLGQYGSQYGKLSLFWMLSKPCLALNDPLLIRQILLTSAQQSALESGRCPVTSAVDFCKDLPRKALRPVLTDTSTFIAKDAGPTWQHLSRNNPFNLLGFQNWLDAQLPRLQSFLETRAQDVVQDSTAGFLPAYDTIQKLTFDGFSLATVGQVLPDVAFDQFNNLCRVGTQRMARSSVANWLIPKDPWGRAYRKTSRSWFQRFSQIVDQAPNSETSNSLLNWVIEQGSSDFNREQLCNFCAGVYPGGAVSAPSGITSALHLLSQNPAALASLKAELQLLMAEPLTLDRLESCEALDQVLREALRLRPPVAFFTRTVASDDVTLDGHPIPKGTQVFITNWAIHRDRDYWPDPERFNPARWDRATCEANPYGSDYFFPFGRGDRACIGQRFARVFMKLALAVLLRDHAVTFSEAPETPEFFFAVSVPRQLEFVVRDASTDMKS